MASSQLVYRSVTPFTGATGETARFVYEESEKASAALRNSLAFGLDSKVVTELYTVAEECSQLNWDGYSAAPIANDTYRFALSFLQELPLGTPAPSIAPEPDGHICLEWYTSPRQVFSISVSADGDLHYAALLGARRINGTEPFLGIVSNQIQSLIAAVGA
jgi:hypothetical protein